MSTPPATPPSVARSHGLRSAVGAPILVEGRLWGLVIAGTTGDEALPPNAEERLAGFSELVATAISNATARAELVASRARIVAAGDEARRRIERDLHDGAQQQLVTLAVGLRATKERVPPDLEELQADLAHTADGLTAVLNELREISRGIHPAILTRGRARAGAEGARPPLRHPGRNRRTLRSSARRGDRGSGLLRRLGGAHKRRQARPSIARADRCPSRRGDPRSLDTRRRRRRSRCQSGLGLDRSQRSRRGTRRDDRPCEPARRRNPARCPDPASRGALSRVKFGATLSGLAVGRPLPATELSSGCLLQIGQ